MLFESIVEKDLFKWIGKKEIKNAIQFYGNCEYSNYLKKIVR